jgi:MinD-like ATPase involved in chromosome partitioning or flagellar assembly
VTEAGSSARMPWWDAAPGPDPALRAAAPPQPPPARPAVPPAYQPPVVEGPPAGSGALSLGLGRGSRERELVRQVGVPLVGTRRVVVLSIKGGVGKTTTVAVTGSMLAGVRRDKVVALDASSDWGTLAARLSVVPRQSVRDLAARGRHAVSEHGVLAQLAASPSGLLVVGSDPQSRVSGMLTEDEYVQTLRLLEYVGSLIVTDVGAGLQQPFLPAALSVCDQLVVASAATWDAAQSAGAALDWLAARGFGPLVERSIVVVNNLYPARRRRAGYIRDLKADLARRSRSVHEIPFDAALQPGGRILLRKLSAPARQAYLEVAADIMAGVSGRPA